MAITTIPRIRPTSVGRDGVAWPKAQPFFPRPADRMGRRSRHEYADPTLAARHLTGRGAGKDNRRTGEQINPANPRADNKWGQILEIVPPRVNGRPDHTATECTWEFFLLAGDPGEARHSARYAGPVSRNGWLACPDNIAFDSKGRIWIATDGAPSNAGVADGLYGADTMGFGRALTRCFYQAPTGAEVCGPILTPDDTTVFLAIQHPGEDAGSTFEKPSTRWPDFKDDMPPRPSVIAITKKGGGTIGS